ncbi:MAG: hypothetical protein IH920_05010 [Chloroflexi bacterium]|nr:hypothetical protein [Chloroflexota bacterium]
MAKIIGEFIWSTHRRPNPGTVNGRITKGLVTPHSVPQRWRQPRGME